MIIRGLFQGLSWLQEKRTWSFIITRSLQSALRIERINSEGALRQLVPRWSRQRDPQVYQSRAA